MPFYVHHSPAVAPLAEVRLLTDAQPDGGSWPDAQLVGPPLSPGTEPRLTTDPTGVAAHCLMVQQQLAKRGMKAVRQIMSQNAQYGVVWRADLAGPGDDSAAMRLTCWRIPKQAGYSIFLHPLQMFDPSQSVPPLAP
jgi:hypothetical protein